MFFGWYFFYLLIATSHIVCPGELAKANSPSLKKMISDVIPLRQDGKMAIPGHLKHVKLDVGLSNHAPYSQYWLTHEDDLVVFGFEPNPTSVDMIKKAEAYWHGLVLNPKFIGTRFFLLPYALGLSVNSSIKFYVTGNDCGCSSIYPPKYLPIQKTIEVPIFSLSDFFDIFPFDTHPVIDYIKIDAQGADLDIAKSAGDYLKERVIYITLEAENYHYENTNNSAQAIDDYMLSIGFIKYQSAFTTDPTYLNSRFSDYVKNYEIKIYQI